MSLGSRTDTIRRFRRTAMFLLALVLVAAIWELYKLVGPQDGGTVFGWTILPRANDQAMPHVWTMLSRYLEPERAGFGGSIFLVVLQGAWFTFRLALTGFVMGTLVGLGLAVLMARFRVVERGLLPYLVVSQTVPLIALAPLVVSWGGKLTIGGFEWPRWLSAAVLGAFLAFFPVAVGTLRGLKSAPPASLELMDSYAASWRQTLFKLRFPAALPHMVPALKLARHRLGRGRRRGRALDRARRRDRAADHRVRAGGHGRPREGVHGGVRGGRARPVHGRARHGDRRRRDAEPAAGGRGVSEQPRSRSEASRRSSTPAGRTPSTRSSTSTSRSSPGEFVSLIGPSGCGKSTQLRLIANLTEPTTGEVLVNGKPARKARLDQDYGMAFQQAGLFDWRSVTKNVELPLELKGWDKAKRRQRALEMLELVKLPEFADHFPWQLSGGMQQRVAIARALAAHPPLLLMDEPFGALDEMTREHMQAELLRICGETSTTVVFVTHSIPEAVYLSTRVVVMSPRPGRITDVIEVDLGPRRDVETREADAFFKKVTEVREALRGIGTSGIEPDIEQAIEEPVEG